jgi:tRNA(fMet)-specific endonuclease VapC
MYLLDTNILTALYAGNRKVIEKIQQMDNPQIATTIVNKAEIIQGRISFLLKANDGEQLIRAQGLLAETERLLIEMDVVSFGAAATAQFEILVANRALRKAGRPDLLIASITLANKAILVTRNTKDFEIIPGLRIENWMK